MSMSGRSKAPPTADSGLVRGTSQTTADRAAETAPGPRKPGEDLKTRQEALLDEAVEETFPASDSIAPKRIT